MHARNESSILVLNTNRWRCGEKGGGGRPDTGLRPDVRALALSIWWRKMARLIVLEAYNFC